MFVKYTNRYSLNVTYKVILCDFDYTLGDSTEGIIQCVNAGLKATGYPQSNEDSVKPTIGLSLEKTYEVLTGDKDIQNAQIFTEAFKNEADRDMAHTAYLYDGALPFLRSVKDRGKKIGIVTTKYNRRIVEIFEKYDAMDYIDLIVGGDSVRKVKPDPEGINQAIDFFGIFPKDVLFIGDSDVDAEAAYSAGVDFIGVRTGFSHGKEFSKFPNIAVLDDLFDVMEFIFQ